MSQDGSIYTVESGAHDKSGLSRLPWRAGVRQTDTSVRTAALRPIWLLQLHLTEPQVTRWIRFLPFVAVSLTRDGRGNGCYRGINTILAVPGWSGYEARGFPGSKKKKCMSIVSWLRGCANTYLTTWIHPICMIFFGQNVYSTLSFIFRWVIEGPYIVWIQVTRRMICKYLLLFCGLSSCFLNSVFQRAKVFNFDEA